MLNKFIIASLTFCIIFSCQTNSDSKEIVFVCTHGAARSPIAAAYFNRIAAEHKLKYHAVFRGTHPDDQLTKETVQGLNSDGFDIKNWKPKLVSQNDINNAYQIITFDCTVPTENSSALQENWSGTPSPSKAYENYTAIVKEKVKQLVEQLPSN